MNEEKSVLAGSLFHTLMTRLQKDVMRIFWLFDFLNNLYLWIRVVRQINSSQFLEDRVELYQVIGVLWRHQESWWRHRERPWFERVRRWLRRPAHCVSAVWRHSPDTPVVGHIDARFFLVGGDVIWSFQVLDINVWQLVVCCSVEPGNSRWLRHYVDDVAQLSDTHHRIGDCSIQQGRYINCNLAKQSSYQTPAACLPVKIEY